MRKPVILFSLLFCGVIGAARAIFAAVDAPPKMCWAHYVGWGFDQINGVSKFHLDGNRIGAICGGVLWVKEGLQGGWLQMNGGGTASLQLSGNRIGALYSNGILSCKDGLYGTWYDQTSGVSAFQLKGDRIGALSGGNLFYKEGMFGSWLTMAGNTVAKFQLQEY